MRNNIPDFFIIGAPKCGTTALYNYLQHHPNVFMPQVKEPHYFAPELSDSFIYTRDFKKYCHLFAPAQSDQIKGEASVLYLYSATAIQNILKVNPNAKFIVMYRNPVDMAVSLHVQFLKSQHENIADFETAWKAQDHRKRGVSIPRACDDPALLQYKNVCALGSQIEALLKTVTEQQCFFMHQEDLKHKSKETYAALLRFLNVPSIVLPDIEMKNKTTGQMPLTLERRLKKEELRKKAPFVWPILYGGYRAYINYIRPIVLPNYTPAPLPEVSQKMRGKLKKEFKNEIEIMSKVLKKDFSIWYR